jgi:predicted small metal-binding protein
VAAIEKVLRCECGFEIRARNDEVLVKRAQEHARNVHGMELSAEQVLQLAVRTQARVARDGRERREQ